MRIIRHPKKGRLYRPVVALGTFDGVHLGHQQVLKAAVKYAQKIKAHSAAITFDPHPQEVVAPERGLRLLTTLPEREELLAKVGVDSVIVVKFNQKIRSLTDTEFIKKYLVDKLGVRSVFVGYDYAFGRGRHGSVGRLHQLGKQYGFSVTVIPPVKVRQHIVKSGLIRELLSLGDFDQAIRLLGHAFRLTGKVVKGDGRGCRLGFPTANLKIDPRKLIPEQGVYVGYVAGKKCVVNIGCRPTFGRGELLVEVHLLNYSGNLRGHKLKVDLFKHLRSEKQFVDAIDLVAQIKKDIVRARHL